MRIITKRIKVIAMTEEELAKFYSALKRAEEGHTSHYAEEKLDDGSYLGVSVVQKHDEPEYGTRTKYDDNGKGRKVHY